MTMARSVEDLSQELLALRESRFKADAKITAITSTVDAVIDVIAAHEKFGQRFVSTDALRYALRNYPPE